MSDDASRLVFSFRAGQGECDPQRVDLLGGKGASLAALSRAGFFVPPGFTIAAPCCAQILAAGGEWPEQLWPQIVAAMQQLELDTGRSFGQGGRPLLVAVRSGAAVSMPGMMDTILNCGLHPGLSASARNPAEFWQRYAEHIRQFAASVQGVKLSVTGQEVADDAAGTTGFVATGSKHSGLEAEETVRRLLAEYRRRVGADFPVDPWQSLRQSVQAVFASWNSERARVYRRHHGLSDELGTAVNVQMMFDSERSGVLFTTHPQRPAAGEMLVEASWGLGEAVVSGAVTPDVYVLNRSDLLVKEEVAGERPDDEPALTARQLLELGQLGLKVEQFYGHPCDLEWGFAEGQLALLQSRAIRGLEVQRELELARSEELQRLKTLASSRPTLWVAHNLGETLPAPTPLTWSILRTFMSGAGGFGELYRILGFHPSATVCRDGFLELLFGRVYCDPQRAAELFFDDLPFEYRAEEIVADPRVVDGPPRHLNLERADPWLFLRLPKLAWRLLRASRQQTSLRRDYLGEQKTESRFQRAVITAVNHFIDEERSVDLRAVCSDELLRSLDRRRRFVLGRFSAETLLPGYLGGLAQASLQSRLTQYFGAQEGALLAEQLIVGHGDVTVEQNQALFLVAQGRQSIESFVQCYGHRAANEMELARPRWCEDPVTVQQLVRRLVGLHEESPQERSARQQRQSEVAERSLLDRLAERGAAAFHEEVLADVQVAKQLLPYRELGKFHLLRGYALLREVTEELARRWELGGGIYFLEVEELPWFEQNPALARERIVARQLRWKAFQKMIVPEVINSAELERLFDSQSHDESLRDALDWSARSIASGQGEGVARIVLDPNQARDLGEGYVLVCPTTDPGWTPLFVGARALIVERGGVLSHGAIVARDFGIPAVVCPQATTIFADGVKLRVDADRGKVWRLTADQPVPLERATEAS
ncbi:MAG: PEP/pyruvate-binding domain-containing protein [Planctomycetota bacterium]